MILINFIFKNIYLIITLNIIIIKINLKIKIIIKINIKKGNISYYNKIFLLLRG